MGSSVGLGTGVAAGGGAAGTPVEEETVAAAVAVAARGEADVDEVGGADACEPQPPRISAHTTGTATSRDFMARLLWGYPVFGLPARIGMVLEVRRLPWLFLVVRLNTNGPRSIEDRARQEAGDPLVRTGDSLIDVSEDNAPPKAREGSARHYGPSHDR